jgi:hypothetical protein
MNKNHLFFGISAIALLLMGLAIFNPFKANTRVNREVASDFYQRHPDWIWKADPQNALIPVTGDSVFPDYFQRHPEQVDLAALGQGASDYFERHPELVQAPKSDLDLTDYYCRHPDSRSIP